MKAPAKEEVVPFELGKKRGKIYVPQYNEAELEAIRRKEAVAEAVRLDDDEEAALGEATTNDLMTLAEILDSNPQVLTYINAGTSAKRKIELVISVRFCNCKLF